MPEMKAQGNDARPLADIADLKSDGLDGARASYLFPGIRCARGSGSAQMN